MSRHIGFLLFVLLIIVWPGSGDEKPDETPPIDVDGLHVLILHETSDPERNSPGQWEVIHSAQQAGRLRKWLEANTEDFGVYDWETNFDYGPQWLRDAKELHDGTVPWLLVADRDSGFVGPLPKGVDAVIELLEGQK